LIHDEDLDLKGKRLRLQIRLHPGHVIAGRVVDEAGRGISGLRLASEPTYVARAELIERLQLAERRAKSRAVCPLHAYTQGDGGFELRSLQDLGHDLLVFGPGGNMIERVEGVSAGARDIMIQVRALTRIAGRVVSQERKPVENARVTLFERLARDEDVETRLLRALRRLHGETQPQTSTGASGDFAFVGIPAGGYRLRFEAPGYLTKVEEAGRTGDMGEVMLEQASAITGTVLSEGGEPLAGASVWLVNGKLALSILEKPRRAPPPFASAFAFTDTQGSFSLTPIEPGQHFLEASMHGYAPSGLLEVLDSSRPQEIRLFDGMPLVGRVVDHESGEPVSGASVAIEGGGMEKTDSKGLFTLLGAVPSDYSAENIILDLRVEHPDFVTAYPGAVPVQDGVPAALEVRLSRWKVLSGRVVDKEGAAVGGAKLQVTVNDGEEPVHLRPNAAGRGASVAYADDGGWFALHWADSHHGLWVSHDGYALLRVPTIHGLLRKQATPLTLVLGRGATLRGRLISTAGQPVEGAVVGLSRSKASVVSAATFLPRRGRRTRPTRDWSRTTVSARDGKFEFRCVEPGQAYHLEVTKQRYGRTIERIDVAVEGPIDKEMVLHPVGPLTGRVQDAGSPIAEVPISAWYRADGTEEEGLLAFTRSLPDGGFRFDDLPTGDLRLEVTAVGFETKSLSGLRTGSEGLDLSLDMQRLPEVAGVVIDDDTSEPVRAFDVNFERVNLSDNRANDDCQGPPQRLEAGAGHFRYTRFCPQAAYRALVSSEGYCTTAVEFVVTSGDVKEIAVRLVRGFSVTHVVRDFDTGAPVEGAMITWLDAGGCHEHIPGGSRTSGESGTCITEHMRGRYRFQAHHADYVLEVKRSVEIGAKQPVTMEWALRRGGTVVGRLFPGPEHVGSHLVFSLVAGGLPPSEGADLPSVPCIRERFDCSEDEILYGKPFEIRSLTPGTYRVHVVDALARRSGLAQDPLFIGEIVVSAGQTVAQDFRLR
jgi:protocatechuate 3,4-dioxygenase beta subunit